MINLLPPTLKEQMRYAKLNRQALRYLRGLVAMLVLLAAIFGTSYYFLDHYSKVLAKDVADKQKQISSYGPMVKKAQDAAARLTAIKAIQGSQTRYSLLLDDLAKVLPKGVTIDSITLTGDDKKPVRITVTGNSYNSLLAFRESMAKSPRVSGVDLETVSQSAPSVYSASVVIAFKPGQAR